jgi:CRP-like cAMP-binding protein
LSEKQQTVPFWDNLFRQRRGWQEEATRMLADTPIFTDIPKRVLRHLVDGMYHRHYHNNEAVFHAGDPGLGMYLVLSGAVLIQLNGRQLAELGTGDFFGEVALFGEEVRTADAISSGESELIGFFRPDLQEWVERSPKLGVKVLLQLGQVLAERLRNTNERLITAQNK